MKRLLGNRGKSIRDFLNRVLPYGKVLVIAGF